MLSIREYLEAGETTISNLLFDHYQKIGLKYIDRILLAWERKNITTKEQVAADQKKRKDSMIQNEIEQQGQTQESLPKVTLHNWLNPEDSE